MNKILLTLLSIVLTVGSLLLEIFAIFLFVTNSKTLGVILFFLGLALGILAKTLKDLELFFVRFTLSIAILFLTLSLFLYPLFTHSEDIAQSIQPSIDQAIAFGIKKVLEDQINESEIEEISVLLGTEQEKKVLSIKNLKNSDIQLITEVFELEELSKEEQELFTKLFIQEMYSTLEGQDIPIPLSETKRQLDASGLNLKEVVQSLDTESLELFCSLEENELELTLSTIKESCSTNPSLLEQGGLEEQAQACRENPQSFDSLDKEEIKTFCEEDLEAKITVLLFGNEEVRIVNPKNLSDEEVRLIWENLGFPDNVSNETKETLIQLSLTLVQEELEKEENIPEDFALPLASVGAVLPEEIGVFVNYDLFSSNREEAAEALSSLREECLDKKLKESEFCQGIALSDYDTLMENIDTIANENITEELPINLTSSALEPLKSINSIQETLENSGSYYIHFFIAGILFFILSIGLSERHFIKEQEEHIGITPWKNTLAFFSRNAFISILPYTILLTLPYILLKDALIFKLLPIENIEGLEKLPELIASLPILKAFTEVFGEALFYTSILLIFFFLLAVTGYILRRQELIIKTKIVK